MLHTLFYKHTLCDHYQKVLVPGKRTNHCILKDAFSSKTHPFIFTSIAPEFFQHQNQQATSLPSLQCLVDQIQSSEANSSC